tara:strand:+ start:11116 stop:11565 length:450 start_codon:yes stop_codon:yes gene_type:complete
MAIAINGSGGTITGISAGGLNDDSIAIADLSATGTASASTFLRGDNTWASAGEATLKAWAAFDGDGDVNATLTGGNITSLTDHGTGSYTITFDTDFADDNYMMAGAQSTSGFVGFDSEAGIQTGSCKIGTLTDGGGMHDSFRTTVGFWR